MKRNIKIVFGALMLSVCLAGCGSNSDNAELEKKVAELEAENDSLREQLGQETENDDANPSVDVSDTDIPEITVEASGVAGADVTWEYGGGVLIFRGTGETTYFGWETPYDDYIGKIARVYVDDGITTMGGVINQYMSSVAKVQIADSVKEIVGNEFNSCNLKEIDLSNMNIIDEVHAWPGCLVKLPDDFELFNGQAEKFEDSVK